MTKMDDARVVGCPEGWKLVPEEATDDMVAAIRRRQLEIRAALGYEPIMDDKWVYRTMVAAALNPPVPMGTPPDDTGVAASPSNERSPLAVAPDKRCRNSGIGEESTTCATEKALSNETPRCEAAKADALRLHREKMDQYEARIEVTLAANECVRLWQENHLTHSEDAKAAIQRLAVASSWSGSAPVVSRPPWDDGTPRAEIIRVLIRYIPADFFPAGFLADDILKVLDVTPKMHLPTWEDGMERAAELLDEELASAQSLLGDNVESRKTIRLEAIRDHMRLMAQTIRTFKDAGPGDAPKEREQPFNPLCPTPRGCELNGCRDLCKPDTKPEVGRS